MPTILVINPNSSKGITDTIEANSNAPNDCKLVFLTAPEPAPASINNSAEGRVSADALMSLFKSDPKKYFGYDAYLICCYSDHPFIYELRKEFEGIKKSEQPIVMGIFQASMNVLDFVGGASATEKACILTSGTSWQGILDRSVCEFTCGPIDADVNCSLNMPPYFLPTVSSGVGVLQLADPENFKILEKKAKAMQEQGCKYVILGCAGLCSLDGKFRQEFPDMVWIDSCKIGIEAICGYARMRAGFFA